MITPIIVANWQEVQDCNENQHAALEDEQVLAAIERLNQVCAH